MTASARTTDQVLELASVHQVDGRAQAIERRTRLMGGELVVVIYDVEDVLAAPLLEGFQAEGLRLQKIFNLFDPESELSSLNERRTMAVSDDLAFVLEAALRFCALTDGEYDVSLGRQILARKAGRKITPVGCSYRDITINGNLNGKLNGNLNGNLNGKLNGNLNGNLNGKLNGNRSGNHVTLTHPDVIVDLGSIAKGYIVDRLGAWLHEQGVESFFIDGRGDMLAAGEHTEEVVVQHPRSADVTLAPFTLKDGAVATSGDYNQYYGSYDTNHILRQKELISVTVVAPTLMEADAFASAVYLSTPARRAALLLEHASYKVCMVDKAMHVSYHNGFAVHSDVAAAGIDATATLEREA